HFLVRSTTATDPLSLHDALPIFELDVQFTEDRQLVVFHDDTLDRMTPVKGGVGNTPWPVVSALPLAGSGEHAPLFTEVLRTVARSEEHTSELQSRFDIVCRLLPE